MIRLLIVVGIFTGCFYLLLLSACSESSVPFPHKAPRLASGVSINNNIAGSWAPIVEVAQIPIAGPNSLLHRTNLVNASQGGAFLSWETIDETLTSDPHIRSDIYSRSISSGQWQRNLPTPDFIEQPVRSFRLWAHGASPVIYATWRLDDATTVYMSYFSPDVGWSTTQTLGRIANAFIEPRYTLIVDNKGNATFVWASYANDGTAEIHARYIDRVNGLSLMSTFTQGKVYVSRSANILLAGFVDEQGITQVFWVESSAITTPLLWRNAYDNELGWSKPIKVMELASKYEVSAGYTMEAVKDPKSEEALIMFRAQPGSNEYFSLPVFSVHSSQGHWTVTQLVDESLASIDYALNDNGVAVVAWSRVDLSNGVNPVFILKTRHFDFANGWGNDIVIFEKTKVAPASQYNGDVSFIPDLDINNNGHIALVWSDYVSSPKSIQVNLYTPEMGWGLPTEVASRALQVPIGSARGPSIAPKITINVQDISTVFWVDTKYSGEAYHYIVNTRDHDPNIKPILAAATSPRIISQLA